MGLPGPPLEAFEDVLHFGGLTEQKVNFNYTANGDFAAVGLPYGDSTFSMVVMLPSAEKGGPVYFKADRPFLYVIRENSTGAIVFMGKVGRPEYS